MIVPPRNISLFGLIAALALLKIALIDALPLNDGKFSDEDLQKLKPSKSYWSGKYPKCKKQLASGNENTNVDLAHGKEDSGASSLKGFETVDLRSEVESVKDKERRPPENGTYKTVHENKSQMRLNRFKRKTGFATTYVSSTSDPSVNIEVVQRSKKNYKKVKFAETQMAYKGSRSKEYPEVDKYGVADKGPIKKKTVRRRSAYSNEIARHSPDAKVHRWKRASFLRNKRHSDANATDYYAQRKAVMDRFYSRQREIAKRYGKVSTSTPRSSFKHEPRQTILKLPDDFPTSTESARQRELRERQTSGYIIDEAKSDLKRAASKIDVPQRFSIVEEAIQGNRAKDRSVEAANTFSSKSDVQKVVLNVNPTSATCPNISLSGTFAPKTRRKSSENGYGGNDTIAEVQPTKSPARDDRSPETGHQRWGNCEGKLVYQHNLLLSLKGNSNLDAVFEVIIQGPICITCVETMRYNETRAIVFFDSGGRGHDFVKLRLQGYKNEGFSYIVKVWGIRKTEENCEM